MTRQSIYLIGGRILSMPMAFLVPIVLVRSFNIESFGLYKQLFLIFNILLPVVDFGISQSLLYFLPKYRDKKNAILTQTIIMQLPIFVLIIWSMTLFSDEISMFVSGGGKGLSEFITRISVFALLWHISNILESYLIADNKSFQAGLVTFFSETVRSVVTICIALLGGGLAEMLTGMLWVGSLRLVVMAIYFRQTCMYTFELDFEHFYGQLFYSLPFGVAVIINSFVLYGHQFIVSSIEGATAYAMYAVGCFSLPFLSVIAGSVSKVSLVRMSNIVAEGEAVEQVADIIQNSVRKLWLIFFPVFVLLYVIAEQFVIILYTENYLEAVPVFKVFILMIPLSACLVQHVPRAFGDTRFILFANIGFFIISLVLSYLSLVLFGLAGAAGGFIFSNAIWRFSFLIKCSKLTGVPIKKLLPLSMMARSGLWLIGLGGLIYMLTGLMPLSDIAFMSVASILFAISSLIFYWGGGLLLDDEKSYITCKIATCFSRIRIFG